MTIEYDEEVKLHDGEMLWVHITRHYILSGGALGDGAKPVYVPTITEISWDTGFKGVGRKSVFFTSIQIFDKYQGNFYAVGGTANQSPLMLNNSFNCKDVGIRVLTRRCLVALNSNGDFFKAEPDVITHFNSMNILYPEGINNWGSVPKELDGKKLSWNEKISLQHQQSTHLQRIGKPFLTGE